jgi:hypothetical protein
MTLPKGQALAAAHIPALVPLRGNRGAAAERPDAPTLRAVRRASITATFVTAKSGDKAARFLALPPWAIYPMKPDACALLTCNLLIFHAHPADRITEALETGNLQARWLAAAAGTRHLAPGEPLL